ncbi:Protein of unknown function (DUF2911) [Flavobacteriaceae bacterium MAR_2010_72]|nr:Protein of unknown function (DUF2911) [Flavobacteriaceae bacterium MAR_2010_72]
MQCIEEMNLMKKMINILQVVMLTFLVDASAVAQDVQNSRRMSHRMEITRTVGTTEITIIYHSPTAQGRKIFGGIVPTNFVVDGKEYPWRAGSNERTTIAFTHDVTINGHKLSAGKYGLVVLVNDTHWTFVFSNNYSWGAFQYSPENDVLRLQVEVEEKPHQDWLSYNFVNPKPEAIGVELRWETLSAQFKVETDVSQNILSDLTKKENKTARDYRIMAIETMAKHPENSDLALDYLELALANMNDLEDNRKRAEEFAINMLKADYLIGKGEIKKGKILKEQTIPISSGFDMYYYALNLLIVKGDKDEAYRLLSQNIINNPNQWQAYLAMGEYYLKDNYQKEVVKNFKRAFELAPENSKNYARYLYLQNKLIYERN